VGTPPFLLLGSTFPAALTGLAFGETGRGPTHSCQ
jgi:hypothetical protein